jgi:hypothetical protein
MYGFFITNESSSPENTLEIAALRAFGSYSA